MKRFAVYCCVTILILVLGNYAMVNPLITTPETS